MHPVIEIPLFELSLPSHGLMVALAAILAAIMGVHAAVRVENLDARRVVLAVILIASLTFAAGRLHFALANSTYANGDFTRLLSLPSVAIHAPGAIIGATLAALTVLPLLHLPIGRFVDAFAPAVGIGIATARLGCFLYGCCYGGHCQHVWCVTLPSNSAVYALQRHADLIPPDAMRSLPMHPLPLYFAGAGIAATILTLWLRRRRHIPGELGLVLLAVFSISSALLEPLRADDRMRVYWGAYPQLLWITSIMALLSIVALAGLRYFNDEGSG